MPSPAPQLPPVPSQAPRGSPSSGIHGPSGSSEQFALQLDAEFSTLTNDFSAGCFSRGKRDVRGKRKGERQEQVRAQVVLRKHYAWGEISARGIAGDLGHCLG